VTVRPATKRDLDGVAAIYAEQVRAGISTFDLEPPPPSSWAGRLASTEP
jgi:L-amino acid N-acyltransferase YncA